MAAMKASLRGESLYPRHLRLRQRRAQTFPAMSYSGHTIPPPALPLLVRFSALIPSSTTQINLNFTGWTSPAFHDSRTTSGNTSTSRLQASGASQQVKSSIASSRRRSALVRSHPNPQTRPPQHRRRSQTTNTAIYLATDQGATSLPVQTAPNSPYLCWSPFGTGLPDAPAVRSARPAPHPRRRLWPPLTGAASGQTPLFTAGAGSPPPPSAHNLVSPASLFGNAGPSFKP